MIAFGISSKATVSYDAEVEYLESTGTQWIDTGHIPTINTKWDITCASTLLPLASNNGIGVYRASNKMRLSTTTGNGSEIPAGFYFSTGSFSEYYYGIYDNDKHDITFNNSCGTSTAYVSFDGTTIHEFGVINSLEEGASIYLFAYNGTRGPAPSKFKIYSSKIYEGDVLVQDLIPVRKDGKGYMYDRVSKKLFSNSGTGEFIIGADKEYWGLKFTAEQAGSTISMTNYGTPNPITLLASTDGNTWTQFIPNETTITLANVGDYVYFKAGAGGNKSLSIVDGLAINHNWSFALTGKISASGNVMSLLDGEKNINKMTNDNIGAFAFLFDSCTALTQAPELPAETLATGCYCGMFLRCTALTQAPELPAETLADECYAYMFQGCTKLTQAPALPATTLADYCYNQMFRGCTSLTQAPELPAETLAARCYYKMFYDCTGLNSINVNFSAWNPTGATDDWVSNVSSSGTFTCPEGLPETYGAYYIPEGWTIQRK